MPRAALDLSHELASIIAKVGLNPNDVAEMVITPRRLEVRVLLRNEAGRHYVNATGDEAVSEVRVFALDLRTLRRETGVPEALSLNEPRQEEPGAPTLG